MSRASLATHVQRHAFVEEGAALKSVVDSGVFPSKSTLGQVRAEANGDRAGALLQSSVLGAVPTNVEASIKQAKQNKPMDLGKEPFSQ
eukprot:14551436-Alexandrium_andersonii.AAC.1